MSFIKSRKFIILLIMIFGLLVCAELFYLYWQANYNPYSLSSFCSINDIIDCDGIEKSFFAQVFGIPFACWGMFVYFLIILFLFVDKLKNIKFLRFLEVFKNPRMYIAALGYIAFVLSLILAITAYINVKKICLLCAVTYLVDLTVALVATDFKNGGIIKAFKTSVEDLIAGVKIPKYGISFAICVLAFISFLIYTTSSYVFVPHLKSQREIKYFENLIQNNPYRIRGNVFGDENPTIIMTLYTDYECPLCRINNVMLNKAIKEVKGVQVIHKNFPLDKKCNSALIQPFHQNSCMYARYAVAAEKQGKWGEMNDLLFSKQPQNEDEITFLAKELNFDTEQLIKDANSLEVEKEIQASIKEGLDLKIVGTPVMIINNKTIEGIQPYKSLKKILEDAVNGNTINVEK